MICIVNDQPQQRRNECCPPRKTLAKKSFFGAASILSAFGAVGLAGVSCLGCIPMLGAALATSSFAALLDDHLAALQIALVILSATLSFVYFRKGGSSKLQRILVSTAYLTLIGNVAFVQNRFFAAGILIVLIFAHLLKVRNADLKLLYFQGCPTYFDLKKRLDREGLSYKAIDLESLKLEDPLRRFSSPTIIFREELLYGTPLSSGSMSCSYSSKEDLEKAIKKAMALASECATN